MPISKLPVRPSLESLRKQAKKLARDISAGDAGAIARARAQLPRAAPPLSQRDAQLVLAREYGFPGWKDLLQEVSRRLDGGLGWAVTEARRIIHDNDVEALRRLLTEYPALLSWKAHEKDGGLLGMATGSFGDSGDPFREERFTRKACAELLLDAGAVVAPSVCDGIVRSRAQGLIDLFHRRGVLPESLRFLAAVGDTNGVRLRLDADANDPSEIDQAFLYACRLGHSSTAELLLDRAVTRDAGLGKRIDAGPGRSAFIRFFIANMSEVNDPHPLPLWQAFAEGQIERAMQDGDLTSFVGGLRSESWLLSDAHIEFQVRLIEGTAAALNDRSAFLKALLDLDPAVLHAPVAPASRVLIHAFTYAQTRLLPMLLRIWPLPDDLPHAAGAGDLDRVKRWFDAAGHPKLGSLTNHFPANDAWIRGNLNWGSPAAQQVLDTALAWAVMNSHFGAADYLLLRGANIDTNWNSHEPASILHELVWHGNYPAMQFLIDRGIDMTIVDYRWGATAEGWARYAAKDETMANWLADARRRREGAPR